jgi:hypothetical protein
MATEETGIDWYRLKQNHDAGSIVCRQHFVARAPTVLDRLHYICVQNLKLKVAEAN